MIGKLRKSDSGWVVDYLINSENPNAIFTFKSIPLHPDNVKQIEEDSKVFDNIEARIAAYPEVEFEIIDGYALINQKPEDFIDEDNADWERASLEDYIDEKDEELVIELEDWNHRCSDGCCYTYGVNIYINGEQIEDEDGTSSHQLLKAVLNKLGYTNVTVEYK